MTDTYLQDNQQFNSLVVIPLNMGQLIQELSPGVDNSNNTVYLNTSTGQLTQIPAMFFLQRQLSMAVPSVQPNSAMTSPIQLPISAFQPINETLVQQPLVQAHQVQHQEDQQIMIMNHMNNKYDEENNKRNNYELADGDDYDETNSIASSTTALTPPMSPTLNLRKEHSKRNTNHIKCHICSKIISRDFSRHLRTHNKVARFQCIFPHQFCRHRTGNFHRPYDFKKHLLNHHFKFDDPLVKKLFNLRDKVKHIGTCSCGSKFIAKDWLEDHILTDDEYKKCPYLDSNMSSQTQSQHQHQHQHQH